MKKSLCGLLAALMMLNMFFAVTAFAVDNGFDMEPGIGLRVTKQGADAETVFVGDVIQAEIWVNEIAPHAVMLPLMYNPEVVKIVSAKDSNAIIENGYKTAEDYRLNMTGFTVDPSVYDNSYDLSTMKPLYWNGRMQYTKNYPYINNDTGIYKMMFWTIQPSQSRKPQRILTVDFKVVGEGDTEIGFATKNRPQIPAGFAEDEYYDVAASEGVVTLFPSDEVSSGDTNPDSDDFSEVYKAAVNYQDKIQRVTDKVVAVDPATLPPAPTHNPGEDNGNGGNDGNGGNSGNGGNGGNGGTDTGGGGAGNSASQPSKPNEETKITAELADRPNISMLDVDAPAGVTQILRPNSENVIDRNSTYYILSGDIAQIVNDMDGKNPVRSIVAEMPEKILSSDRYQVEFNTEILTSLNYSDINDIYIQSPYCVLGVKVRAMLSALGARKQEVSFEISPSADGGVTLAFKTDTGDIGDFGARVITMMLPYSGTAQTDPDSVVAYMENMPGAKGKAAVPMCKYHPEKKLVYLTSSNLGTFTVRENTLPSFVDLDSVPWAEEHIMKLAKKEIISGTGDGLFQPDGLVTREEFTKMLVGACGMYQSGSQTTVFQDVSPDAWYAVYIGSAYHAKLVNGVDEQNFGLGSNITRQDIAAMVYRAVKQMGLNLGTTVGKVTFQDNAEIADYAKEAVEALQTAGIISGYEDGNFVPEGNATRAEAAKIINGIFQSIMDKM